jgi:hypothetical protein
VSLNDNLFDDLGLTGAVAGTDFGETTNQMDLAILAISSPLAAGVTVSATSSRQTFGWGVPGAGAIKVAALTGNPNRAAIFAYDRNQPMVGMSAPGRRVGWFAARSTAAQLATNGWKLFDDAIQWAAALPPCAPNQGQACGSCGGTVRCDGTCSPDPDRAGAPCVSGTMGVCRRTGLLQCSGGTPTLVCSSPAGAPSDTFQDMRSNDPEIDLSSLTASYDPRWDWNCNGQVEIPSVMQHGTTRDLMCSGRFEAACNQRGAGCATTYLFANCDTIGGVLVPDGADVQTCGRPTTAVLCIFDFNNDGRCNSVGSSITNPMSCK